MLHLLRTIAREPAASTLQIDHAGETFHVMLKRVRGARRYTLRVRTATRDVVLTMPVRGSLASARAFAERQAPWIGARLKRLPPAIPFADGAILPLRGIVHRICHCPTSRGVVWVTALADVLPQPPVSGQADCLLALCVAGAPDFVARRVRDYLKRMARIDLEAAVRHYTALIGVPSRSVTVRDTTSRWGSCSSNGSLNFSWRLILAPAFVLDYLAAHEVAHLVHMNHSDAFWALLRRICPQTDQAEVWLKAHGSRLHQFGNER